MRQKGGGGKASDPAGPGPPPGGPAGPVRTRWS